MCRDGGDVETDAAVGQHTLACFDLFAISINFLRPISHHAGVLLVKVVTLLV